MKYDAYIKKITRYLASKNTQPLIVNVQNCDDLEKIRLHFNVDNNEFINASEYCKKDELPQIETLVYEIINKKNNCFIMGLSSFLRFYGEDEVKKYLLDILNLSINGHVVVITYQCENLLNFSDPRLSRRICLIDGIRDLLPKLEFIQKGLPVPSDCCVVYGIENVVDKIETLKESKISVITNKRKEMYSKSIYYIENLGGVYDMLIKKDNTLTLVDEEYGSEEQWSYLYNRISLKETFAEICDVEFGNHKTLELVLPMYNSFNENKKWLYYIALKIYGANSECLTYAIQYAKEYSELIRGLFRSILIKDFKDPDYYEFYQERKQLLVHFSNCVDEVVDFCKMILQKEENKIYYLTDNTTLEKELIITSIGESFTNTDKKELENILSLVYPDLFAYINDYRFNIPLLDEYFSLYTHSKIINKVLPKLEEIVIEQAVRREYNLLLEPRSAVLDRIDKSNSHLYFMDAMGVEYLSYILAKCKEKGMMANIQICTANLPSITSKNKEFISEFEAKNIEITSVKELDEIKHHGINDYDYTKRKEPIHLIEELKIIDNVLNSVKSKLIRGLCSKVIMISDHGASRLAVIHETENHWEMQSKGEHSGRCCPKLEADVRTEYATEEDGFWVLANYDRFKGGRKANIEVHGGATLEEVVVPIIEFTIIDDDIEISIVEDVITVSYRKKASIKLFSKTKLHNVTVKVDDEYYDAIEADNNMYIVDMPKLKKSKKYNVDVFASNNLVASDLTFEIKKEISQEKDLF